MPELLPSGLLVPSITEQRASVGLTTPEPEERAAIWESLSIPSAGISADEGGYKVHRIVKRYHDGPWRYCAVGGGLRGGKSLGLSCEIVAWAPHSNLIWLAGETYDLCRQEFEYVAEALTSLDWVQDITMPKNKYQPCALETPWGCRIETRSLHDLGAAGQGASLVARAPDFIGVCEPGFAPAETLKHARERLSTRRGRLWMAGTFEAALVWFTEIWKKWTQWPNADMGKSIAFPSWLNIASFPGGRNDPEIKSMERSYATFEEFLVRWGGIPLASGTLVMGAYWDEKKHVSANIEFEPYDKDGMKLPVRLAVDPGFSGNSHYSVEVLQQRGTMWVVVDEVAVQSLVHEEVIDLCRTRPWWKHVAGGIIDPNAGTSHVYGGNSPQEVWWNYGRVVLRPSMKSSVDDSVSRLQFMMRDPSTGKTKLLFSPNAKRAIYEMTHWKRITTKEGMGKPSDINCDALKALAYFFTAEYTKEALGGYNPGEEPITVADYSMNGWVTGGPTRGVSRADRYRNLDGSRRDRH